MQQEWEERAHTNAYHWVMSTENAWDKEKYYKTGEDHVAEYVLPFLKQENIPQEEYSTFTMLDIGCGTGRLTRALAKVGAAVTGIDISQEMIQKAKEDNAEISNATFVLGSGKGLDPLPDNAFDFCYSFIVFQHIPDKAVIHNYFHEIKRVLKPGRKAKFQVRGTPGNPPGKVIWFIGFRRFYIALCIWRKILPVVWIHTYGTVYGACFRKNELKHTLTKVGFTKVNTYYETDQHLWAEVQA